MPYLGRQPSIGRFAHLDDITSSFNSACTTFSLMQSSVALVPGAASNLIISLGGVLQEPEVAYTVAGSSIIFSSAPASTQPFFGILLGDVLDVGQVSQGAVINATSLTVSTTLGVTGATTLSSTVATGALTVTGAATYTTSLKSTTALATPGALSATQATAFASTVSGAAIMGFGTTNDVSLMNRAGTVVLGIGPNTTTVNMTGLLTVSGFGTHSFSAGGTGSQVLSVRNTTAGQALAEIYIGNDASVYAGSISVTSSTYTAANRYPQDGLLIEGNRAGGINIAATGAAGAIKFYSGGTTERMTLSSAGLLTVSGMATLPWIPRFGTYTAADTTPSVANVSFLSITNSSPITITNFDDWVDGQIIVLLFTDSNTTINRSNAYLSGAVNFVSSSADILVLRHDANYWYEVCRSVNG